MDIIGVITTEELVEVWGKTLATNNDGFAGLPIRFVELLGIVIERPVAVTTVAATTGEAT